MVNRFGNRENLLGMAIYGEADKPVAITTSLAPRLKERPGIVTRAVQQDAGTGQFLRLEGNPVHMYAVPLHDGQKSGSALLLVLVFGFFLLLSVRAWKDLLFFVLVFFVFFVFCFFVGVLLRCDISV